MQIIIITTVILAIAAAILLICKSCYHQYTVADGHVALFYHNKILMDALPAGHHTRWGRHCTITLVDTRKTLLPIADQQVLTADNVSMKVNITLTTQIVNAVAMVRSVDNYSGRLPRAASAAVRDVLAGIRASDLAVQRERISASICATLAPLGDAIGVHVHDIEVRDAAHDLPV